MKHMLSKTAFKEMYEATEQGQKALRQAGAIKKSLNVTQNIVNEQVNYEHSLKWAKNVRNQMLKNGFIEKSEDISLESIRMYNGKIGSPDNNKIASFLNYANLMEEVNNNLDGNGVKEKK